MNNRCRCGVSILPRLATGIGSITDLTPDMIVSILPRLATGIHVITSHQFFISFYSSPSCDGDHHRNFQLRNNQVSILPRLATGIYSFCKIAPNVKFLFFPVLRRGSHTFVLCPHYIVFLFFPVLRRGSYVVLFELRICLFLFFPVLRRGSVTRNRFPVRGGFYSSPSCDGDRRRF